MMELLVKDYEESICSVEKLFGKFTETMLAHVVDPVLTFKRNLEKALDKSSTSLLAIKELCTQSEVYDFEEEYQTKADLLSHKGLELLTDVEKKISLFEKQSSRKSSRSSHLRRSLHKHELKKIALDYELKLNDLAIKKEKALLEMKQRFRCESDNLKHVTEINLLTTTNNHDAVDLNKDSDKLVDQNDDLEEVAKPSSKCEITPVSNNNSQDEIKQKQVSHVPRVNYSSQCSRHLSSNNNTSAFRDDAHSYLDVGSTPCSSNQVSSCAVSNSGIFVNSYSAVCFRTLVKEESSSWDTSANLKQNVAQCVEKYSACMDNLLESKHAEDVSSSELNVTDTVCVRSVQGAFPPRKSDKCVVFHSSAQLQDMCLNDFLLKTSDLIHSQLDMLRCRSEKVALSSDTNLMFYNFLVSLGFRDFICFLWFHCTHRSYRFTQSMFVLCM